MGFVEALKTWLHADEIGLVVGDVHFTSPISSGPSIPTREPSEAHAGDIPFTSFYSSFRVDGTKPKKGLFR